MVFQVVSDYRIKERFFKCKWDYKISAERISAIFPYCFIKIFATGRKDDEMKRIKTSTPTSVFVIPFAILCKKGSATKIPRYEYKYQYESVPGMLFLRKSRIKLANVMWYSVPAPIATHFCIKTIIMLNSIRIPAIRRTLFLNTVTISSFF